MLHLQLNLAKFSLSARIMNRISCIHTIFVLWHVQDAQNAVLRVSRTDGISLFRRDEKSRNFCLKLLGYDNTRIMQKDPRTFG